MAKRDENKILDPAFIGFVKTKPCLRCGAPHGIDAHHEGIIPGFDGRRKSYIDYQALPLCHHCHLEVRHKVGYETFWGTMQIKPDKALLTILIEYRDTVMRERDYDNVDEYEQAESYIEEVIDYLKGS